MRFSGRRTIVSLLLLSTLCAGSVAAASSASASTAFAPTYSERHMVDLINQSRRQVGRAPLALSFALSRIARTHSALMAAKNTIFHTSNLAYQFRTFSWTYGGENVGMGPTIDALHKAFMASLHHRQNNLNGRFHRVGVGVVWKNGIAFITVEFLS